MNRTFKATRISEDNIIFPPTIIFSDKGVTIKMPSLFHHYTKFFPYEAISVSIHCPLVGFSSITFFAYGREMYVHGFYKKEVMEMKRIIEEKI